MDEKTMLLDLKQNMESQLEQLGDLIILSDPRDDEYKFLLIKAANYRDTLKKIDQRLKEL
ncbi:hypothetical protein [Spirosoma flavum]|uniref:Uncharacterized protein n=1 Tax=Spirosoma flavum TaxID=2048557 RepID=A0ABW6AKC2_9BACT